MSARPEGFSDSMLEEMRRMRGSSEESPTCWSESFHDLDAWDTDVHNDTEMWWCYSEYADGVDTKCWLTEAGHKALAAIEAEESAICEVTVTVTPCTLVADLKRLGENYANGEFPTECFAEVLRVAIELAESRPNSSAPLTGWTREWPIEPGWYWLRSNLWVPEQRSTPVECVDADGRLEYVSNTGTHVVGFSEHWLWASMDSPPPETPKDTP